jgi:chemotaxis protein methyltransferase CheR
MIRATNSEHAERFRTLLARRLGLHFDDAKLGELGRLLARRASFASRSHDDYIAACETDGLAPEIGALAEALTVPETYFFRDPDQLRAFTEVAIPSRVRAQAGTRRLRILSAGCASGEEAYTLAMLIRDTVDPSWEVSILGVDLNPAMVAKARQARYTRWALRETPGEVRHRWFRPQGREFVLDPSVCAAVRFEACNLVESHSPIWRPDSYDIVFFRNVSMYFAPEQAQAVIASISRSLKTGGYLFLGYAETLRGLSATYHLQHTHGTFYYQWHEPLATRTPSPEGTSSPHADTPASGDWIEAIGRASARVEALANPLSRPPSAAQRSPGAASDPTWDLSVGLDLLREERFTEAAAFLRGLPPEAACDRGVLLLNAVLATQAGWLVEAEAACKRLLAADRTSAPGHYLLALCREGAGDREGAARYDQIAVYLDGTFAMPHLHLGLMARRTGDDDVARRELGQALSLLECEEDSRLFMFASGFGRTALLMLCRTELQACGDHR